MDQPGKPAKKTSTKVVKKKPTPKPPVAIDTQVLTEPLKSELPETKKAVDEEIVISKKKFKKKAKPEPENITE